MRVFISVAVSIFLVVMFSGISLAAPFLHDPQPANNSYTKGGTVVLSVNITDDNLELSSAVVKIIELGAYQQGEEWVTQNLSCAGGSPEWKCSSNFITSTIGSDTTELFYFEAKDADGATGNNGTVNNSLRFTLDRNPPQITFVNPVNNSYVSGNETITITVTDTSSGGNNNTVRYSIDGLQWITMKNDSINSFEAVWNTTTFSDNRTVALYVNASDNVNNSLLTNINVTVDNEVPQMVILSSLSGILNRDVQLQVNVSDSYSGIDWGNVGYTVSSLSGALGCSGSIYSSICSAVLDTSNLQDGNYTLIFSVADSAGNLNTSSVEIIIVNTRPVISIIEPANNAFIKGTTLIRAALANTEGIVEYVELSLQNNSNALITENMICNTNFTSCNYSLNTTPFTDGGYTIKANVVNALDSVISSSIIVTIDNTKPTLNITQPSRDVAGDFEIKADVVDTNLDKNKVMFKLSSFNGSLACTPQTPSRFICSTFFNSNKLSDGKYTLNITAEDKAGNLAIGTKEITIANQQPSSGVPGSSPVSGVENVSTGTEGETIEEESKGGFRISFPSISLPFKSEYIFLGVAVIIVIVVVIILIVTFSHRLGETIITER